MLGLGAGTPGWAQAPNSQGIPVTVAPVTRGDVVIQLRNIGSVQGFQQVLVRARIDGTLEKVFFEEGQEVKRGDVLAQIDARPYQALVDLAMARRGADLAQLNNARTLLARSMQLMRDKYTSQEIVDTRKAAVEQFEAQLKSDDAAISAAQVNLDYTRITAPIDGRIGLRLMDPGNVIRFADTAGVGIVTIAQVHPIAVVFSLPQDSLPDIRAAMARGKLPVMAYSPDDKTLLAQGTLITIDNAIDAATGSIKMKASFPNTDDRLWPGQFVNVRLQLENRSNTLAVPSIAVQRGERGLYVFLVKPDGTVATTPVEVGQDDGATTVITKGLQAGDSVVIAGQSRLQNGSRVAATQVKSNS